MTSMIDPATFEIKLGSYATANASLLNDPGILPRVQEYRRLIASRMQPLERHDLRERIPKGEYHVSRKLDGEFTVLVFRDGEVISVNPGGTVRRGLLWQSEAAAILTKAGIREAMIAGELYFHKESSTRTRVHDLLTVVRNPQSVEELSNVRFAVFDIISLDQKSYAAGESGSAAVSFFTTWQTIEKLFGSGTRVRPVEGLFLKDGGAIDQQFAKWVEVEGAEGLVVRGDTTAAYKVKPRHNLDAIVIGFTESTGDRQGMIHDLLLAVARNDGTLQVLTRVGGGFSEDARREMLSDLKDLVVDSEYVEVNSDHVAYKMVMPKWVIEISCLDLISQSTRGGPIQRAVVEFDPDSKSYKVVRRMPLASVISPQFVRRREDKSSAGNEFRIGQISDLIDVPMVDRQAKSLALPESRILRREVYSKELKGQMMVRKLMIWETRKAQEDPAFPCYVLHFTDFSPNRKTPLERELRVSSSIEQMGALWDEFHTEYIKKGWDLRSSWSANLSQNNVVEALAEKPLPDQQPISAEAPEPILAKSEPSRRKRTTTKKTG